MNYGYENEKDYVELFNNKYIEELDENSQLFLKDIFNEMIDNDEKIISWKNRINQKTDIFIKYKNHIKNVSLKCGNNNSVHQEPIQEFQLFLEKVGIPYKIIDYYLNYHYGYRRKDGKLDFSKSFSSQEYKLYYQEELDILNNEINKTKIIIQLVDRFIVRGKNSEYDIDALISGKIDDYIWIKKDDIYDLILSTRNINFTSPHVGSITIGPKKRNLNRDSKNSHERYIVCGRWNTLKEDIISFKKDRKVYYIKK